LADEQARKLAPISICQARRYSRNNCLHRHNPSPWNFWISWQHPNFASSGRHRAMADWRRNESITG